MKTETLQKIEHNLHNGCSVVVPYSELCVWYEIPNAQLDDEYEINITSEGDDYWLEIFTGDVTIADEIITCDSECCMADWLYNR